MLILSLSKPCQVRCIFSVIFIIVFVLQSKAVNGDIEFAEDGQFPFMVSLTHNLNVVYTRAKDLKCDGVLLSPWWILASKSCLKNYKQGQLIAIAGTINLKDIKKAQVRLIAASYPCPQVYAPDENIEPDLELVKLKEEFFLDTRVFHFTSFAFHQPTAQQSSCKLISWNIAPDQPLAYVPVKAERNERCDKIYGTLMTQMHVKKKGKNIICGILESSTVPNLQSGAPLVFNGNKLSRLLFGTLNNFVKLKDKGMVVLFFESSNYYSQWIKNCTLLNECAYAKPVLATTTRRPKRDRSVDYQNLFFLLLGMLFMVTCSLVCSFFFFRVQVDRPPA